MKLPERVKDISPFIVMEVLEKAKQMEARGIDVVHLEVGEPDFNMPEAVIEASNNAALDGHTKYTSSLGDPELRHAICRSCKVKYDIEINPEQVVVTSGTSPALHLILSVIMDQGENVIIPDPGYACYPNIIRHLGGLPRPVLCHDKDRFQYRINNLEENIDLKTAAIIVNSPSNPTGQISGPAQLRALASLGQWIISDEIYHGLEYENTAHSMLEYSDQCFVVNGFSKLYAMTGLRIGYLIAPREFIRPIQKLQQNLFICASSIAQRAAIAALEKCSEDVSKMHAEYNKRRLFTVRRLRDIGFGIAKEPEGAFYVFADARKFGSNSYKLAFDILEKAHVGVTPGIDFGAGGEGYLRFSYANSLENIETALDRIAHYLEQ